MTMCPSIRDVWARAPMIATASACIEEALSVTLMDCVASITAKPAPAAWFNRSIREVGSTTWRSDSCNDPLSFCL